MQTLEQKIEVMQAFTNGAKIEVKDCCEEAWTETDHPGWNWVNYNYRIAKPEPVKLKLIAWLDTATLQLQWFAEGCDISWDWKRVPSEDKEIEVEFIQGGFNLDGDR